MDDKLNILKNRLEAAAGILLVVLCGYFAANLFVQIMERRYLVPPRAVIVKKNAEEKQKIKTLEEYLASMKSLFPKPTVAEASSGNTGQNSNSDGSKSPDSSNMKLVATIVGDDTSLAIISVDKKEEVVSKGQTFGNYQIKEIKRNVVVLKDGGQEIALRMKFGEKDEPKPTVQPSKEEPKDVTPGVTKKEIARREFEAMIDPPDRVAREIGFAPVSRDGKPYGIQLTFVKPGSFLQQMGFMPGDVLASINNKPLYTPEDGMLAYQMMKNEDTVDFKIDRNGKFMQLQIVFK